MNFNTQYYYYIILISNIKKSWNNEKYLFSHVFILMLFQPFRDIWET